MPDREIEAVRDLVRAREDARADLMRVRHRLSKLLLRQGIIYSGGHPWTGIHELWLRRQRFDDVHPAAAFDHYFDAVLCATAAPDRLDEQIAVVAASPRFADQVDRLGCLRGVSALTGLALSVEIGDWSRFTGLTTQLTDTAGPFRVGNKVTATLLRPEISLYVKIAGLRAEGDARCVLDLGCSAGALGAAVGRSFGEAKPLVIGMDASPTMLSAVPAPVA